MNQLALSLAPARARSSDPATSHEAAGEVDGRRISDLVLGELKRSGPGTSHDIAERLGLSLVTVSPRMKPLEDAGLVKRAGRQDGRTLWERTC